MSVQARELFLQVWGVGDTTADKFWRAGCRSLSDLERRPDLTMRQVSLSAGSPLVGHRSTSVLLTMHVARRLGLGGAPWPCRLARW
jgi:Fingers domain of DNA polymerase lambda